MHMALEQEPWSTVWRHPQPQRHLAVERHDVCRSAQLQASARESDYSLFRGLWKRKVLQGYN